ASISVSRGGRLRGGKRTAAGMSANSSRESSTPIRASISRRSDSEIGIKPMPALLLFYGRLRVRETGRPHNPADAPHAPGSPNRLPFLCAAYVSCVVRRAHQPIQLAGIARADLDHPASLVR